MFSLGMTTLIGIHASNGEEGIILASDINRTQTSWQPRGDIAYRQQIRSETQKIYVNDSRDIAICMSGLQDLPYFDFLTKVLRGTIDIRNAIQNKKFEEFLQLHLDRWGSGTPNEDLNSGLLLATRFEGAPKLYSCWPLGGLGEFPWISIGSGSRFAHEYLSKQDKLIPGYLSIQEGIDLAVQGLDAATQDIFTGGLDLVVITKSGIQEHGRSIKQIMLQAKATAINDIKGKYRTDDAQGVF